MRTFVRLLAVFALAACSSFDPPGTAEGTVISMAGVRPGYGVVESVGVLRNARAGAAKSETAHEGDPNAYRLYLRMDGGFQTVDVDNSTFIAGEHIEITKEGRVRRITGTALRDTLKR